MSSQAHRPAVQRRRDGTITDVALALVVEGGVFQQPGEIVAQSTSLASGSA